ncbi:unnamed protein product [Mytilus coruscus]|uniref:B box-type domain-containing protein n=1 Tax=Mytilus coruscus TaxID=42192 RepID=A0A6J8C3D3_MYTCO|nr:unnamed protein product [Mytilus coruscus]
MSGNECDPCGRMGSNCSALQWCSSCHELLCARCYNYHKVLGVTKDHTVITVEEYEAIVPFIASVQMKCSEHSKKEYEYYCKEHDCTCCVLCKQKYHFDCSNIQKIDEFIEDINTQESFHGLNDRIQQIEHILRKLTYITVTNISILDEKRKELFTQLHANRLKINNALDNFEAEIRRELHQNFDSEMNRLFERRNEYLEKMDELKKEKHVIGKVANIELKSNKQLFLLQGRINDKLKLKESAVKDLITSLEDVSSECNVDLDIDKHSGCLMLTRTVAFHRRPFEIDLEAIHIESESETIEVMEEDEIQ